MAPSQSQRPSTAAIAFVTSLEEADLRDLYRHAALVDDAFAAAIARTVQEEREYILGRGFFHLIRQYTQWRKIHAK